MASTNVNMSIRNNLLNALYGKFGNGGTSLIPTSSSCYLGFSTAAPTISEAGEVTAFPEPAPDTGYQRIKADMDNAANGSISNGSVNLTWPAPNEGKQYGKATHIGLFPAQTNGLPIAAFALTSEVTLGLKNTLILYKDDLTTTLTVTETASA